MPGTEAAGLDRLAVIGIGNMGLPMARRLVEAGHVVGVHDLRTEAMHEAEGFGAKPASDAALAGNGAALAIVAVVDAPQCEAVLFGTGGLCHAAHPPHAVMLCSTIGPADVERFARRLDERSVGCIDAPMSGGPARAADGTMSLMVACPQPLFLRFDPVLQALSSRRFHVGEQPGKGARTKLVNNLLAAINLAGAAEAMALAIRLGLDSAMTLSVIEQSSGASWIGSERLRRALAGDTHPRAHMSLLAKDAVLALQMVGGGSTDAARSGLPVACAAAAVFEAACREGWRDADDAALLSRALSQTPRRENEP
ncbi:MAG: NAD(P)-dependent oxidoreductase [Aquabacterium sp.]